MNALTRSLLISSLIAATTFSGIGFSPTAQAVHDDGLFQLDYVTSPAPKGAANVSSTNISPAGNTGDDWDKIYANTSNAFATSFIVDGVGTDEKSFFTGGGSKDTNDIPDWLYDTVKDVVPDKDDIAHAFAAAYDRPSDGHTIVYFGADRFDAGDGSAELGFWFFRDDVKLNPLATNVLTGTFNGTHRVGDLLVLVEYVRGGAVGEVNIYEWDGAGGDNLKLLLTRNAADCATTTAANDMACAVINNTGGETPPWPYLDKDGHTAYQPFALFEGGIDFTELLGGDIGCFSAFMAETRSSGSSVQAQLKDFALGAFPICNIDVSKTGDTLSKIGDPVDYTITIANIGRATLYKRNINDTLLGAIATDGSNVNPSGYVLSNTCGASLTADNHVAGGTDECTITLQRTVQAGDPDPLPNTVTILYSEKSDFTGLEFNDSDDHDVNLFQPAVMIEKTGDELSKITDNVTYNFKITNMSSADSPNLTLATISDDVIGDLLTQATAAGCDVLTTDEVCSFSVQRTVQAGDDDPLVNTVDVLYHPVGFPNNITASDGHSVNLFQPSVSIVKTGDTLSKIGDEVTYRVKIVNTSSSDSPNLILDSIDDDVLGDLASYATGCASLKPGASCTFDVPWTVAAVDVQPVDGETDDPVINTVTIHFHPEGFPNDITATGSHELNLFQPAIAFAKTADTKLSKATDDVNYMLTLNNTSSADSPNLACTISDAKLGINKTVTLASGKGDVTNVAYTVQAGDPDPLVNTAKVSCSPIGFPNVLTASSEWTVELFQPSVMIEKTGDTLSKIGDDVIYHFKVTNTSSKDSPQLKLESFKDDVLGDLMAKASTSNCDNLAPGTACEFDVPWTVAAVDVQPVDGKADDPVINTVSVLYHPVGFPNDITAKDDHSLNLFQPAITFDKSADTELSKATDEVIYKLTLNNTSSADTPDLVCKINDALLGLAEHEVTLSSGGSWTQEYPYIVQAGDPDPLNNTAKVSCSPVGFPNILEKEGTWSVNLFQPAVMIEKTGDELSKIGDSVTYNFTITNMSSANSPDLTLASITDNVIGSLLTQATAAGCDVLTKDEVCSFSVQRTVQASDPDPLVNTVDVLYHPTGFPNDITASDGHSVNLFDPAVSIVKTGDTLSKIGDDVTYHFTIKNTGSADSPNLILDSIVDDVLGDLSDEAPAECDNIAPGASCTFDVPWTVTAVDVQPADGQADDPVINTVTIHFHPEGFPNDITATGSHELNLFQPAIAFAKTADTKLSKATDVVNYKLTLNNNSSADSPDLVCTITDATLGVKKLVTLAAGQGDDIDLAYTVQAGDPDPLVNTAKVSCSPIGFPNVLTASSEWTVELFQPSVMIEKTGDTLSKIGDDVTYHIKIVNTSSSDSPSLILDSIVDDVLDNLKGYADECNSLAPGAECTFDVPWTVALDSPDPVVNTVGVHFHPEGFPNDITASDDHSLNLFQPAITFDKSADTELSKATDVVNYTLNLTNNSSKDSPDLVCTITDVLAGIVGDKVTLPSGGSWTGSYSYTVKDTDDDPLVNTAKVSCSPAGFPNILTTEDTWSVNLFQPSVKVTKTGPAYSKAGDVATYYVSIENTSSTDAPDLVLESFTDSLVAGVTPPAECETLATGASCSFSYDYIVKAGDSDPLVNTATAHYNPDGFPNDISNSASYETDLLHPTFTVAKACSAQPIQQTGPAVFNITFNNTGDADLHVVPDEGAPFDVAAGKTHVYQYTVNGPFEDTVNNIVTVDVTLAEKYALSNSYNISASASCTVYGKVKVVKTVSGQIPPAGKTFTFQLRQGATIYTEGTILWTQSTDANGNVDFGQPGQNLVPGSTYQLCELVEAGWNTNLAGDSSLFVPASMTSGPPPLPNPNVNNLPVCTDFSVQSGKTRTFIVDNTPPPGGRALTIGYWKNWASCSQSSGKGQKPMLDLALGYASKQTANPPGGLVASAKNAGLGWPNYATPWYLILKGNPLSTENNILSAEDCLEAVRLLDKTTIGTGSPSEPPKTIKKMSSDPLFNMAAQLVAAQLNRFMGAGINGNTITNIDKAVLLLGAYGFNGNSYNPKLSTADISYANCLATQLDNYNNNRTVSTCNK